jgi:transposase
MEELNLANKKAQSPVHANIINSDQIINRVINFLQLFICQTLAKRIISMILISLGLPNARVTELTGLCDKSVRTLKKELESGSIDSLFHVGGGGRHSKMKDVEKAIVDEINQNNYHSHQQIVDMVQEKFKINVSTEAVRKLLKKTALNA